MHTSSTNHENRSIIVGIITAVALILFFLLMKYVGLVHNIGLRFLNAFIMFGGVFYTVRNLRVNHPEDFNFLKAIAMGMLTAFVSAIIFSLFVFTYVGFINPAFMETVKEVEPFGDYLNPFAVSLAIFIEAIASGFLFSYASVQLLKMSNTQDTIVKEKQPAE